MCPWRSKSLSVLCYNYFHINSVNLDMSWRLPRMITNTCVWWHHLVGKPLHVVLDALIVYGRHASWLEAKNLRKGSYFRSMYIKTAMTYGKTCHSNRFIAKEDCCQRPSVIVMDLTRDWEVKPCRSRQRAGSWRPVHVFAVSHRESWVLISWKLYHMILLRHG